MGGPGNEFDYSVVIPTVGRTPALLRDTVDSVWGQSLLPREVIVVVDGRPDLVESLEALLPDCRVVLLAPGGGAAGARQRGFELAMGEWIAMVDDDDLWVPEKMALTAAHVREHPECHAVRAGYWMFAAKDYPGTGLIGQTIELRGDSLVELLASRHDAMPLNDLGYLDIEGHSLEAMLERNRGVTGTSVFRRRLLDEIPRVPDHLMPGDDYLLFCHIASVTEWHLIPQRLEFYRVHGTQSTSRGTRRPGVAILRAKRLAWDAHEHLVTRSIGDYGPGYRAELRQFVWAAVKRRSPGEVLELYRLGWSLLPRWRDRFLSLIPEPIAWRVSRLGVRAPSNNT